MAGKFIEILGARTHNLKNISVNLPLGKITVITGVSGSGKSSLAFDTLYAEGQRRFVESMSTYARQFIEKMARPDVDQIRNIQPAIAIEQKNSVKNARSTIGTATEISDYLRLLFAKAGTTICPDCKIEVREDSPQSVADEVLVRLAGQRVYIVAPFARSDKVSPAALKQELVRSGFTRVLWAAQSECTPGTKQRKGKKTDSPAEDLLARTRPYINLEEASGEEIESALCGATLRVLVDRAVADPEDRERLSSSVAVAFQAGHGTMEVHVADLQGSAPLTFHAGFRCNGCGREFARPEPNLFSFNSPLGACRECSGFGRVTGIDWDKVIPDRSLTLNQKPIAPFNSPSYRKSYSWVRKETDKKTIPWDVPLEDFTEEQWEKLLFGYGSFEGIKGFFDWLAQERYKVQSRIMIARYRGFTACDKCRGTRLVEDALNVKWAPADGSLPLRHIGQISKMSIESLLSEFISVKLNEHEEQFYGRVFQEILSRLTYLVRVGLGYLTLDRQTRTLSGGEAQRINLATALGTSLTQTLYVLDEPTVGLHPRDSRRLLEILRDLRDKGNTIVVVEHDPELILGADMLVDIGPRAGSGGGQIVFSGSPDELSKDGKLSLTAEFLFGKSASRGTGTKVAQVSKQVLPVKGPSISIVGAHEHNLKHVNVDIPLKKWVCVSGVSGSGKTTLIHNVLFQAYNQYAKRSVEDLGKCSRIDGLEQLTDILLVDQSPIGRSIRSNPVTYVKAYDQIRKLFASIRESRALGLTESSFSFNVTGGRCETCEGTGVVTYDMHFLAELTLPCEICGGKRFTSRVLEVRYKGKNIDDVLSMTIDDASEFFADQRSVIRKLEPLHDVGLGYLTLGQNTSTLSGGEAQRLKLAGHLSHGNPDGGNVMMIFDEPTTGLHLADLAVLSAVFRRLVDAGYSLIVIEHNLEIIRQADWVIDLGPEGGAAGGALIAAGPPKHVAGVLAGHTGRFLRDLI